MDSFLHIFGIEKSEVKPNVVIVPFLTSGMKEFMEIFRLEKGQLYSCANTDNFTFIKTGIGATLVGDCVLHLKGSAAKNIIFLGACGLTKQTNDLDVGSVYCPTEAISWESFSQTAQGQFDNPLSTFPNQTLVEQILKIDAPQPLHAGKCATFGSLALEEKYLDLFTENKVDVVDMECAAFFQAATMIEVHAAAILYATDIIKDKPFFRIYDNDDAQKLRQAVMHSCQLINEFYGRLPRK